ncbi:MAG: phosphopantothenoylcysteine decarboxylase, partial [Candidatus Omnitrophica bacterium]|nr:phosphopantothenoylcysteine decarboxylase [Candidatus Omnitrophota bacterium]
MKILITAGATWIKIDSVRILTNRFSGKSGLYLAKELKRKGHSVTLLINPHCTGKIKGVSAVYYRYFEEFKDKVIRLVKTKGFDFIIHMAAVSDYKLKASWPGKIASGRKSLDLKLIPAEKIIVKIRKLAPKSTLIQFKLEASRKQLIDKAYQSLRKSKSDFVVANSLEDMRLGYKAFLIDP